MHNLLVIEILACVPCQFYFRETHGMISLYHTLFKGEFHRID